MTTYKLISEGHFDFPKGEVVAECKSLEKAQALQTRLTFKNGIVTTLVVE